MNRASQVAFARKLIRNKGVADDLVDVEAEIDEKLSFEENWSALKTIIEPLIPQEKKVKEQVKETKIKELEAQTIISEEYSKHIAEERELAIRKILASDNSEVLNNAFRPLRQLTKMVFEGYSTGLIVEGPGAVGKTHNVLAQANENGYREEQDYAFLNTYSTPLEFYRAFYNNKDKKAIVLDDVAGLFDNPRTIALLKSALWGIGDRRIVQYNSSTDRLGSIPDQFIMNAGIIILTNRFPKGPHIEAIISRCHYLKLSFSREQVLQLLYDFAKHIEYKGLTADDRLKVVSWIKENTNEAYDVNFRTLLKMFDLYRFDKEGWIDLAKHLLTPDKTISEYITAVSSNSIVEEQAKAFCRATGMSRATFFRIKADLKKEGIR